MVALLALMLGVATPTRGFCRFIDAPELVLGDAFILYRERRHIIHEAHYPQENHFGSLRNDLQGLCEFARIDDTGMLQWKSAMPWYSVISYGFTPAAASTSDRKVGKSWFFLIQTTTEKSGRRCVPLMLATLRFVGSAH
jgi:hypothetical protein